MSQKDTWKDTVITSIEEVDGTTFLPADYISWREHQNLMEAQARTAFFWGYHKGLRRGIGVGKKRGIREVREWMRKQPTHMYSKAMNTTVSLENAPEWQAQLKVWGIKSA